jgi:hypothetical protein
MTGISPPANSRTDYTIDDWITPQSLINRLGPFDLDPCESDTQPWPCAERGYRVCRGEDGLMLPWDGFWFLNPPYGALTGRWLNRGALSPNGIALVYARTETRMFFRCVWPHAAAVLFIKGRVTFCRPSGEQSVPGHNSGGPSCLIAYGQEALRRLHANKSLGALVQCAEATDLRG